MQNKNHTPGEWKTERSHSGRIIYSETQRDFDTTERRILAFLTRNEAQFPVEQADCNGKLMAASPALLSALVAMFNKYGDKSAFPTCDASISARAALMKAGGAL